MLGYVYISGLPQSTFFLSVKSPSPISSSCPITNPFSCHGPNSCIQDFDLTDPNLEQSYRWLHTGIFLIERTRRQCCRYFTPVITMVKKPKNTLNLLIYTQFFTLSPDRDTHNRQGTRGTGDGWDELYRHLGVRVKDVLGLNRSLLTKKELYFK